MQLPNRRIRVLIVDDSALVRDVLTRCLSADPAIEVVGTARDPYEARDLLVNQRPDVITLDIEMPRMDGLSFLRKYMAVMPTPTIVLSSLVGEGKALARQAFDAGAIDVLPKPSVGIEAGLEGSIEDLVQRIKSAAGARVTRRAEVAEPTEAVALHTTTDRVIGIGASTGGVAALGRILPELPAGTPGVVVVQHMAAGFTEGFARRLDALCAMRVREAQHGDRVLRGHILIAPGGDRQLRVVRQGGEYRVDLRPGPLVSGHKPSVDVLFESLALCAGRNAIGCLMTGMGADGARGLLQMRAAGAHTLAQDRASCAVWGMPAAAAELGAAERLVPLTELPGVFLNWARRDQP